MQQGGTKPSRALPYVLHVHDLIDNDRIALAFVNSGQAGAVFHVYDKRRLQLGPRRYTVEAGKELRADWLPDADGGYDLWVLGPNGFHRHFCGHGSQGLAVRCADGVDGIAIALANPEPGALACTVSDNVYGAPAWIVTVAPGASAVRLWPLAASGNWYDLSVQVHAWPGYLRRLAWRIETGSDGISDPAMGAVLR